MTHFTQLLLPSIKVMTYRCTGNTNKGCDCHNESDEEGLVAGKQGLLLLYHNDGCTVGLLGAWGRSNCCWYTSILTKAELMNKIRTDLRFYYIYEN